MSWWMATGPLRAPPAATIYGELACVRPDLYTDESLNPRVYGRGDRQGDRIPTPELWAQAANFT